MLKINNGRIQLTKGDTASIYIQLVDEATNKPIKLDANNKLTFTVRKKPTTEKLIVKEADEIGNVALDPQDTSELDTGIYLYDVQLWREGNIYTVIPTNYFELKEEITNND